MIIFADLNVFYNVSFLVFFLPLVSLTCDFAEIYSLLLAKCTDHDMYLNRFRFVCTDCDGHQGAWMLPGVLSYTRDAASKRPAFPRPLLWRHTNWAHHEQVREGHGYNWFDGYLQYDKNSKLFNRGIVHPWGHCVQHAIGACGTGTSDNHVLPHTGTKYVTLYQEDPQELLIFTSKTKR